MREFVFGGAVRSACAVLCALSTSFMPHAAWAQADADTSTLRPVIASVPSAAEASSAALSLRAATERALKQHPDLRAAMLAREATQAAALQAGAFPNPAFSALLEDARRDTRTTTLELSQPIELGGKRTARLQLAETAKQQADTELLVKTAQIKAEVFVMFQEARIAQERVSLSTELNQLADCQVPSGYKHAS